MKTMSPRKQNGSMLVLASMSLALTMSAQARAELVYDNDTQQARPAQRETMRQAIGASQKAKASASQAGTIQRADSPADEDEASLGAILNPAAPAAAPAQQIQTVQVQTQADSASEVQHMSKSELMRRERMREEMKNEDILQERLEELRLRDEQRRTDKLLGTGAAAAPEAVTGAPLKEEVVTAPVTEKPGQGKASTLVAKDELAYSAAGAQSVATEVAPEEEKTRVYVSPRIGLANMSSADGYDIQSRVMGGVSLGVYASDNIVFETGYSYGVYGVQATSMNPYVVQYQLYNNIRQPLTMKQNVVDAGLKLYVLPKDSKIRPYVSGGGAYAWSYINYDDKLIQNLNGMGYRNMTRDYDLSQYLGYIGTGLDVQLSKSISIGAGFKYYTVLSSSENQNLNNAAFAGGPYNGSGAYNPYYSGYYAPAYSPDAEKQVLGGSLARSGFYTILLNANLTF